MAHELELRQSSEWGSRASFVSNTEMFTHFDNCSAPEATLLLLSSPFMIGVTGNLLTYFTPFLLVDFIMLLSIWLIPYWFHTFNYLNERTTLSNGYLGSRNDEERSEMRYVM